MPWEEGASFAVSCDTTVSRGTHYVSPTVIAYTYARCPRHDGPGIVCVSPGFEIRKGTALRPAAASRLTILTAAPYKRLRALSRHPRCHVTWLAQQSPSPDLWATCSLPQQLAYTQTRFTPHPQCLEAINFHYLRGDRVPVGTFNTCNGIRSSRSYTRRST